MRTLLVYFFILSSVCYGQDTAHAQKDAAYIVAEEDREDSHAVADSTRVHARPFNETTITTLKADEDLQYKELPTIAESLWIDSFFCFDNFLIRFFEMPLIQIGDGYYQMFWG